MTDKEPNEDRTLWMILGAMAFAVVLVLASGLERIANDPSFQIGDVLLFFGFIGIVIWIYSKMSN